MREQVRIFEDNWKHYDEWFDRHQKIYQSEIKALRKILPSGLGLEVGVGTGRFASALSVQFGLDPSFNMLKLSKDMMIQVVQGLGEELPFKNETFNFVLIVVTICFVENPFKVLNEVKRTLKKKGIVVLGIIDKTSSWGRFNKAKAAKSKFYGAANFYSPQEIIQILENISLEYEAAYQTLLQTPPDIKRIEEPRKGFGQGGFVVLKGVKNK